METIVSLCVLGGCEKAWGELVTHAGKIINSRKENQQRSPGVTQPSPVNNDKTPIHSPSKVQCTPVERLGEGKWMAGQARASVSHLPRQAPQMVSPRDDS